MVMRLLDLFSGIGGFSYAAEKLVGGYETVAFCEQDQFCQQVLRKHWPNVPIYDDVRTIDATRLGNIDIVAGGFPCQAVSQAGLQKATEDDRWLWDEMLRIIQDCKPKWVIGENVVGLININEGVLFEQVQTDLENEGYSVQSVVIPACAKNAPHRRDRVWIIAHSTSEREWKKNRNLEKGTKRMEEKGSESTNGIVTSSKNVSNTSSQRRRITHDNTKFSKRFQHQSSHRDRIVEEKPREDVTNSKSKRLQGWSECTTISKEENKISDFRPGSSEDRNGNSKRRMGYMADGLSEALSGHFSEEPKDIPRVAQNQKDRTKKLKALGNSIVPQVAAELFYAIKVTHDES